MKRWGLREWGGGEGYVLSTVAGVCGNTVHSHHDDPGSRDDRSEPRSGITLPGPCLSASAIQSPVPKVSIALKIVPQYGS